MAYFEEVTALKKATLEAVARIEEHVNRGLTELREHLQRSDEASMQWRRWGSWALLIVIIILVVAIIIGAYWIGRIEAGTAVRQWIMGFLP